MACHLSELGTLKGCPVTTAGRELGEVGDLYLRWTGWEVSHLCLAASACRFLDVACLPRTGPSRTARGAVLEIEEPVWIDVEDVESYVRDAGLMSAGGLIGETVHARDAVGGRIVDLLINTCQWVARYFVVDTGTRAVLLHVAWWADGPSPLPVRVDLPARALASAPAYPGLAALTPGHADTLYRHYTGRRFAA